MSVNALMPRAYPLVRVPTSVPFTYRDGLTTLQLIECIRCNLDGLQNDLNNAVKDINNEVGGFEGELQAAVAQMGANLKQLRSELIQLINESQGAGVFYGAAYGTTKPIPQIIGDVYDNTRYYGLFAKDYDEMEISALDYDTLETPARRYDLQGSRELNPVLGDFKGRGDFWATLPPKTD
nr:MAG TPA: hypothetical protein [Caudoviricetes sp.]